MTNRLSTLLAIFTLLTASCKKTPQTETVVLKIDGFTTGGTTNFQGGFATDEEAAVTLGPVDNTFTVSLIEFLFGGAAATRDVVVKVYNDDGSSTAPGSVLLSKTFALAASDTDLQQIDVSGDNIQVTGGGSIRVSIQMTDAGVPSVSRDDDGIAASKNWIKDAGGTWSTSSSQGLTGDWVIRATVEKEK
jgi:hypothetical protein